MRFVFIISLSLLSTLSGFSQSNQKIKELERKRKLAMKEIQNTTSLLKETRKNTVNLLNRINLITDQISSRQKVISLLNQEVEAINLQQIEIEKEISVLTEELTAEQKAYSKAIQGIVLKKQNTNKLLFVLSGKSLSESLRRLKYLKDYSEWRTSQITDIKQKQQTLQDKRDILAKAKADKTILLSQRQKEQAKLKSEEEVHKEEIEEANKKQSELQNLLESKQKQADKLNQQIERLIAEEVAIQQKEARRLAREKAKRERAKRLAEAAKNNKISGKPKAVPEPEEKEYDETPIMTKESFKLSSNFASNKGRLPAPVSGHHKIIGRFGTHRHNLWNVKTNSSGIDIQAKSGAQARSVFDGEISRIVAFPGYNNCIIIRHGGYYTFYGNIEQVTVRQGQKVKAGQSLGKIYTDSNTGASQLHFQLWKGTTKLNPEPWIQK